MTMTRRNVAAASAFALAAAGLTARVAAAESDEAAVKDSVEALRKAIVAKDKATLEKLAAAQLSYGHSSAVVQNKTEFVDGVMNNKATIKSLEWPDIKITVAGNNAIARHRWVSDSELDGKPTHTEIGVLQVWAKQDGGWKLLARQGYKLPDKA